MGRVPAREEMQDRLLRNNQCGAPATPGVGIEGVKKRSNSESNGILFIYEMTISPGLAGAPPSIHGSAYTLQNRVSFPLPRADAG